MSERARIIEDLKHRPYSFGRVPNLIQAPTATYYRLLGDGSVMVMPNLPQDAYSLDVWALKGYKLSPSELTSTLVEVSPPAGEKLEKARVPVGGKRPCPICKRKFKSPQALSGHMSKHKDRKQCQ